MRIVCDTNVIVSGLLFGGPPRAILRLVATGTVVNVTSTALFDELERVIARPKFGLSAADVTAILNQAADTFEFAGPTLSLDAVPQDDDDNHVLEAAIAGGAEAVVTGDGDLLDLQGFQQVPILNPTEFLRRLDGDLPAG